MGGGATMRAAAKVAGFGISGGLRGATTATVTLPEHTVSAAAARTVVRPIAWGLVSSSTEDGKSGVVLSSQNNESSVIPKPSWDVVEDWEFSEGEDEMLMMGESLNPVNRLVFGSAPSMDEAMEATSDLKEALEKVYFTKHFYTSMQCSGNPETNSTSLQSSAHSKNKTCVATENAVVKPSMPNRALQAFSLLTNNSAAQSVVAALATDKNVWDAVMQNEEVMEFFKQQHSSSPSTDVTEDVYQPSENELHDFQKSDGNKFMEFIDDVKVIVVTIAKMISDVSEFFHNIFGGPTEGNTSNDGNGNATATNMNMEASFIALAILSIMVVILKRG